MASECVETKDSSTIWEDHFYPEIIVEKITGRSDDMMIVRGVNVFPTQIEEMLLKQHALAPHYQIVLTKEGPLDVLTLNVEPCPETAPYASVLDQAKAALTYDIKALIGVSAVVQVLDVNGIERSVGKARRVIDQRKAAS